jgi:hypothetical protein
MRVEERPAAPKYKNFEEQQAGANRRYLAECRDPQSYRQLKFDMLEAPDWAEERKGISQVHLANRGHYDSYPSERLVTHAKDKRGQPLFLTCANAACKRRYCTDPWLPFSYASVYSYVRLAGDGSPGNAYRYYCRQGCFTSVG